jgi:hypothetical protein
LDRGKCVLKGGEAEAGGFPRGRWTGGSVMFRGNALPKLQEKIERAD